ncbi:ribonuclease J [Patescibacteria group bacterium]|nr:ribonuclease J [Patescibacteria group bacterium]
MNDALDRWIEEKLQDTASPKKIQEPSGEKVVSSYAGNKNPAKKKKKYVKYDKNVNSYKQTKKKTGHKQGQNQGQQQGQNRNQDPAQKPFASKSQKPVSQNNQNQQNQQKQQGRKFSHSNLKARKPFQERQVLQGQGQAQAKQRTIALKPIVQRPMVQNNSKGKVRIIPLGGLDEVGKNMMVIEYENDIIIIDMGFQFPEEDMFGVDYVIPDISYLEKKKKNIKAVILTHGHLDHIGGIPYILPRLGFPKLYGTKLTMGLVQKRIEEFGIQKDTIMNVINPDDTLKIGAFKCNFFRVNHSIPDGVGVVIETPEGKIVHTGDFKFDLTPADQIPADYDKLRKLGKSDVTLMFSDSTNALKPGKTVSEKYIGETLDKIIQEATGRIIIASFSSLIGRIQQILNSAKRHKKKVFTSGRSLNDNIEIATRLGYLKIPNDLIFDIREAEKTKPSNALILTTGSQGEAVSALTRIALNNHKHVRIREGDTVVISATPIVGNERAIFTVIDNLTKLGARVIYNKIMDVHTSGHGAAEDLKEMLRYVKPKYLVPVHGQYHMRYAHKELGHEVGIRKQNAIMINNGDILELKNRQVSVAKDKAETNYILVDGKGTGDIGARVIMDRQTLAENGVVVVTLQVQGKSRKLFGGPMIETRGFIYQNEADKILIDLKNKIKEKYKVMLDKHPQPGSQNIKEYFTSVINKFTHRQLERRPLVIVTVIEVK